MRLVFSILLFFAALLPGKAGAVIIAGYSSAVHDRFASGFPSSPVPNTSGSFIGAGLDWSGVGWGFTEPTRGVTMISDRYFVFAAHYLPWAAGSQLSFLSPVLGTVVTFTVDAGFGWSPAPLIGGQPQPDLRVGRLASPIPSTMGIASYPILNLPALGDYMGLETLIYGRGTYAPTSPRIGSNHIEDLGAYDLSGDSVSDNFGSFYFDDLAPAGEARFEGGDSGSPTFVSIGGQLALIGTHAAVGAIGPQYVSVDNFIPVFLGQMQTAGIPFLTIAPEPGRAVLLIWASAAVLLHRRRGSASVA